MTRRLSLALTTLAGILAASCHEAPPARFAEPPGSATAPPPEGTGPLASGAASSNTSFAIAQPPLALTASDGTGLKLAELRAEAIIDGPLAFTELRLTFENPLDRQLEGTFRITLPQGASLGRFAMKIGGEWQEGEVVELAEARRAYEDFLHRKQDPALMEKSAGNEFSARVFPIPARGTKEIIVAYMHEIHDAPYVLPLRGLPELGKLDVHATVIGARTDGPRLSLQRGVPDKDYVVDTSAHSGEKSGKSGPNASGVRSGDLAIIRVKPATGAQPEPITAALVLVDTSASRVLGFEEEVKLVDRLVKRLAQGQASVTVAAFDQTVAPIFEGRAADFGEKDLAKLRERGALGASDLEHALVWAREQAKKGGKKRVVLVTDGVATAGATDSKKLAAEVARLRESGVERIDALAVGGIRDDSGLTRLVRGQLAHDGIVVDAAADESAALRRLGEATRSNISVKVEGATWAWPTRLDGVQAGDGYSIYAQLPADRPVKISVDGKATEIVDLRKTERPLLERGIAQAKISSMLEREVTSKEDLKKSIVSLAVQQRIMTPYTAMLVLETEQDYARFHIDRRSLTDVLAVQDGAVKRVHRTSIAMPLAVADNDGESSKALRESDADRKEAAKKDEGGGGQQHASSTLRPVARPPAQRGPSADPAQPSSGSSAGAPGGDFRAGIGGGSSPAPAAAAAPPPMAAQPSMAPPSRPAMEPPAAKSPRASMDAPREARPSSPVAPPAPPPPPPSPRGAASQRNPMVVGEPFMQDSDSGRGSSAAPYEGQFALVMSKIAAKDKNDDALATARAWQKESPGDVLALVALGEAAEAKNLMELASRAYGSVIDLFPNRADLRRFAGERLERLKDPSASALAIDSFRKAVADRPDHPSSHRLLAFALLRDKQYEKAFEAALIGVKQGYEVDRFRGVDRILREDLGLIGAAWARAEPAKKEQILGRVRAAGGHIEDAPSLRFVLDWQTDANDVDFHIHDAKGGHAFYSAPHLPSGGDLYADVTTGYGPECFTIRLPKSKRSSYQLEAHYYSRGPMGYGMGKLEVIDHDGNGNLTFEERPFIVMVDSAFVDLGTVKR